MCGLVSLITFKNTTEVYKKLFSDAVKRISHRGPDYSSVTQYNKVLLGHNRLSIIDLHDNAAQPMDYGERYTIVFNGEIYNYKELREELISLGYSFSTQCDTEVLIASYSVWKEQCVQKFNGMWAFVIYDKQEDKVFVSRDRFGIKPLFYYQDQTVIVFASEIKALLPFVDKVCVNFDVLAPYITRGIMDFSSMTFFKGIYRVMPATNGFINLKNNHISFSKYFSVDTKKDKNLTSNEVYTLFEDSIKLRLRSDVKVGACLSGGLDSSSIVALANEHYAHDLTLIHAKSSLIQSDESQYAQRVADYLNLKLHIVEPSNESFLAYLDDVFISQDEPFGSTSIFMQYLVMKKAKELGCKVMLDGQGADEIFLGYEHYLTYIYKEHKKLACFDEEKFFDELKLFRISKEQILEAANRVNDFEKTWDIIVTQGTIREKYLDKDLFYELLKVVDSKNFQTRELYNKSLQALLRYEDRDSMAFGVEARLPFMDYRLVEAVLNQPIDRKFEKGYLKYFLRKMIDKADVLPEDITWRYNKMGFEAPQALWIEQNRDMMLSTIHSSKIINELFTHIDIRRDDFLWKLFSIAKWEEVYNVNI